MIRNPQSAIRNPQSKGFTLLEVILAIAVLAIALTTIGEVARMGYKSADSAATESEAQILAESIMGELASGIRPAQAVQNAPLELGDGHDQWQYSIAFESTMQPEILSARVIVQLVRENPQDNLRADAELVQWFLNPETLPAETPSSTGSGASSGATSGQ
jgi:type II secretion system protein I